MTQLSILVFGFIISIGMAVLFHRKWKVIDAANNTYIDKKKELITPGEIRIMVKRLSKRISVIFNLIKQSESGFLVHRKILRFPVGGASYLVVGHELGHVKSIICKKHRWIHLASRVKFLRRISIVIGADYRFEKEAWEYSRHLRFGYAQRTLKAYRYVWAMGVLDLLSKVIFVAIILRLIF
jgi:hypothetical protein